MRASKDELAPGDIVAGRYCVGSVIGRGGYGAVYEATVLGTGTRLALKVMLGRFSPDEPDARRFEREAALMRRLSHPNIVQPLDAGFTEAGSPFIAFELLQGRSLGQALKTDGALPMARAAAIARDVLRALEAAHAVGIVHRDIKPENVFLCEGVSGVEAKVLDFGVAKALAGEEHKPTQLTATGQMIGTPHYMAPEQVRALDVSPATDIYALGIVMVEMPGGERAVNGESAIDVYMAHVSREQVPLPPAVTAGPAHAVIERAVRKDPAERYRSAADMLLELEQALAAHGIPLGPPQGRPAAGAGSDHEVKTTVMAARAELPVPVVVDEQEEDDMPLGGTVVMTPEEQQTAAAGLAAAAAAKAPAASPRVPTMVLALDDVVYEPAAQAPAPLVPAPSSPAMVCPAPVPAPLAVVSPAPPQPAPRQRGPLVAVFAVALLLAGLIVAAVVAAAVIAWRR
ncbi:MAG: serine/threonine protein kinase [Deltaproteobacteria bacterium]|nr:serine/threonine protein kinase [Deltaproteobacteria bacterium]